MSVNTLCRVCAHEQSMDQMVNIFESNDPYETIAASIIELTGLVVMENDGLPSLCCVQCRSDLIYSVAIRRKCLEAENTLKAVLQITALKLDIQEISVEEDRKPDLPILMECDVANKTRVLNHKCCGCSSSFETENELMEHSRLIHATNPPLPDPTRPFQCNVCYRWIKTQRGIEVHKNVMRNRQFNGEISGRFEIPFVAYDEKSIPNGDSTTFVRELASVDGIKQEDPVEVDDLKIFECSVCEACFLDASSFQKHIEMCQQEANIDCIAIGSNMELTDGTDDHENDPTISSIERGYENDAVESNNSTQQNHKCCGCLTNFDSQDALMEHSQAVHAPDAPKPNEMKPFQCKICYSLYQTARAARIHRTLLCMRRFNCKLCAASFKSDTARLKHHRNVHTAQSKKGVSKWKIKRRVEGVDTSSKQSRKDFQMPVKGKELSIRRKTVTKPAELEKCSADKLDLVEKSTENEMSLIPETSQQYDRACDSDTSIISNIEVVEKDYENDAVTSKHLSQEKHTCCGCRDQFDTENELMEHSKTVHASNAPEPNEEKPFQCDICYSLYQTFRAARIHRGLALRQFYCKWCGSSFKSDTARLKHQRKYHTAKFMKGVSRRKINRRVEGIDTSSEQSKKGSETPEKGKEVSDRHTAVIKPTELENFATKELELAEKSTKNENSPLTPGKNEQFDRACGSDTSTTSNKAVEKDYENDAVESKDSTQENHKCCGCFTNFDSQDALMEHSQAVHAPDAPKPTEIKPFQCKICYSLYQTARAARIHRTLLCMRRFNCKLCGASFKSDTARLKHHRNDHTAQSKKGKRKINRCAEGLQTASGKSRNDSVEDSNKNENASMTPGSSQQYDRAHNSDASTIINKALGKGYENSAELEFELKDLIPEKYVCCGCRVPFDTENEMLDHSRLVHAPGAPPPAEGCPFQCAICYRSFKTASYLSTHCESRKCSIQCKTCEKQFSCYSSLVRHEKLHKIRQCKYCGEKFSKNIELRKHERRVHKKERANLPQHACSVCGKTFNFVYYLKVHMKLHSDETPHKCFCGAQFKLKVYLTWHKKKMHNEGLICKYCKQSFLCASLLKQHENRHTGNKEFQCEICGKEFYTRSNMRHHREKVHEKIKKRAKAIKK